MVKHSLQLTIKKQALRLSISLSTLIFFACTPSPEPSPSDPTSQGVPFVPSTNNRLYSVSGLKHWYLTPDSLHPAPVMIDITVMAPQSGERVTVWLDTLCIDTIDICTAAVLHDISLLGPGSHRLLLATPDDDTALACFRFRMSAPLYVTVTNDWDCPACPGFLENLALGDSLHERHPALVMTHFTSPDAFTDLSINPAMRLAYRNWLRDMQIRHGDETGLHIHPRCSFVNVAGLECIIDSAYGEDQVDSAGYLIHCTRYTGEQFSQLVQCADSVFIAHELGKPVSFRAGGWTAGTAILQALQQHRYLVDGSAVNFRQGEEMKPYPLYNWLKTNWHAISDTSQPYYPSIDDPSVPGTPPMSILEAPDNGILADYIDSTEMIAIMEKLWDGEPLTSPRHFSIGYHPDTFHRFFNRLDSVLGILDSSLAHEGRGPVVYVRMKDLKTIWIEN